MVDRIWEKYEYISITRILDTQFKKNKKIFYTFYEQFGWQIFWFVWLLFSYYKMYENSTEYVVIVCHHTQIYVSMYIFFLCTFHMGFYVLWVYVKLFCSFYCCIFHCVIKKQFTSDCNAFNSSSKTVQNLYIIFFLIKT